MSGRPQPITRAAPVEPVAGRYVVQVPVRWSDVDVFGHVNNARTVTLLEEARVQWMFTDAPAKGLQELTKGVVVASLTIDYRRAISFGDPVTVSMGVSHIGGSAFTIDYQVYAGADGDQLAATASTVLVPVDASTFRARRLSAPERAFLQQYRGTTDAGPR
ncbi:acyl-CoA thioesterase [Nakamurella aerolata]|uniref:Acyl-CoA thioesterase n=1 Tax=Nakamurella aerolata TaxID=1656892 RepID=A0A849AC04_9ACTN|nr:thioesterase family protein [Nakamurella aerolata]NNG37126.1 acyl-CoA thioesterase [Nakamurella aerolata]